MILCPICKRPVARRSLKIKSWSDSAQWTFRTYGKSITWRIAAGLDTFTLTTIATGNPWQASAVVLSENITKTLLLYPAHEFIWNRIPVGLKDGEPAHWRSLAKALTWRLAGSADTLLLTWFYTGHVHTAAFVAGAELFTKVPLYYIHERLWKNITPQRLWDKTGAFLVPTSTKIATTCTVRN